MKILFINVQVAAIGKTFNIKVSEKMQVKDFISLLINLVNEQYNGIFKNIDDLRLVNTRDRRSLNHKTLIFQNKLEDNDKLILL